MNKSWGDIVDIWFFFFLGKMSLDFVFLKVYVSWWNIKVYYSIGDVCFLECIGEFVNLCIMLGGCYWYLNKCNLFNCFFVKNNDYLLYFVWFVYRCIMGSMSKDWDFDYECLLNVC